MQIQPVDPHSLPIKSAYLQPIAHPLMVGSHNVGSVTTHTPAAVASGAARPVHRANAIESTEAAAQQQSVLVSIKAATPTRSLHSVNSAEQAHSTNKNVAAYIREQKVELPTDESVKDLDWTAKPEEEKSLKEKLDEQNKEPLAKQLIDFIQSMWRASALAVEAMEESHKLEQHERNKSLFIRPDNDPMLTYEPTQRVKPTSGRSQTWIG